MSSDGVQGRVSLGPPGVSMIVPPGWEPVGVDRSVLDEGEVDATGELIAAGVAEVDGGDFAANVVVLLGDEALDVPAVEFDEGLVWHDAPADGAIQRVTMGIREFMFSSIATVRLWAVLGDEPLLVVATVDCDALSSKWPTVSTAVRSLFDDVEIPWERWF